MLIELYWKIFFSAYWFAFDWGEKNDPQINACWFVIFIFGINGFSLLHISQFIFGISSGYFTILAVFAFLIPTLFNLYILFSKKYGYKKKAADYNYLSKSENRMGRSKTLLITFIISAFIEFITMLINNPTIKSLILNN